MVKLEIKDTHQTYKDIVDFSLKHDYELCLKRTLPMIGKTYYDFKQDPDHINCYVVLNKDVGGSYSIPKPACRLINEYKVGDWFEIINYNSFNSLLVVKKYQIQKVTEDSLIFTGELTNGRYVTQEIYFENATSYIKPCTAPEPNCIDDIREKIPIIDSCESGCYNELCDIQCVLSLVLDELERVYNRLSQLESDR